VRIRSTKPEFWRSERIASVGWETRLVLKGLESYVDDNGVGKDDLALIVADVFPRDLSRNPTGTLQKVSEAITALRNAGLVWRYEFDGTSLLYVAFWESIQRIEKPTRGRFRRPDGTMNYRESEIGSSFPEDSGNVPVALQPGTGEQGNRGTGNSCAPADAGSATDAEFDEWYEAYPRKRGRGQALKAYRSARRKVDAETLLKAIRQQARALTAKGADFVPYPATWLNGERWDDQPDSTVVALPLSDDGRVVLPPLPKGVFEQ
jgi:hypothetical protein